MRARAVSSVSALFIASAHLTLGRAAVETGAGAGGVAGTGCGFAATDVFAGAAPGAASGVLVAGAWGRLALRICMARVTSVRCWICAGNLVAAVSASLHRLSAT